MISNVLYMTLSIICNQWAWWWEGSNNEDKLARTVLTVLILILAIFWYRWAFRKVRNGMAPLPPGPMGLPLVGYLPFVGTSPHLSFTELSHVYGPIYKLWLGKKLCVVLSSPLLVKEVVRDQDLNFAYRDPPIAGLTITYGGIDILWSPYGPGWRLLRKVLVREILSNTCLDNCYPLRRHEIRKTIRDVYTKIGTPIDIGKTSFLTEFNVVMNLLWGSMFEGEKSSSDGAKFREVVSEILEQVAKPNVSDFFPMLARFDLLGVEKKTKKLFLWIDQFFDSIIDQRRKKDTVEGDGTFKSEERKDFLHLLLKLKEQEDTTTPITVTQIKALLLDFVVGGTDTTSTIVEWVMAEMIRHPGVMKKVQEELADVVGMNNIVEESNLPNLHYLEAVVKETFRLHPVVPLLIPRCANVSCTVGGYSVPKGTQVFLNVWALHRDPQLWDNPSEFKPERFLNDTSIWDYTGNNFQYLPFGSGRRMCAGVPLGGRMMMYELASLLHSFEWQLPRGTELDFSENLKIILKKKTPLIAIPFQRLSNLELYA
ncbi:hypothetical protein L1049_006291 [Liquidambar formosana]|uniref:Cytochrome P450 n=1 Tax=Liquidambar formosana TaxID=63359 RepID=A0AAP0RH03_LIQFO